MVGNAYEMALKGSEMVSSLPRKQKKMGAVDPIFLNTRGEERTRNRDEA